MGCHYRNPNGFLSIALKIIVLSVLAAALLFVLCRLYPEYFSSETVALKVRGFTAGVVTMINSGDGIQKSVSITQPVETSGDADIKSGDAIKRNLHMQVPVSYRPRLALVVDDGGNAMDLAKRVTALNFPMTWAILPYSNFSKTTAELADSKGIPYLLHLPMQAEIDKDGGPYLIGRDMSRDKIRKITSDALKTMPNAIGISNHRGSLATADKDIIVPVIDELKSRGLIFLDSRTSSESVAYDVARASGITAFRNRGFLDGTPNKDAIEAKFNEAVKQAVKRKDMILICHFRPSTVLFLEKLNMKYMDLPVRLVTLSEMADLLSKVKHEEETE